MLDTILLLKYASLIPLGFIEGPIASTFSGYLARLGYLDLFAVIAVFVFTDILSDLFYFFLGRISERSARIRAFVNKKLSGKNAVFTDLWETHFFSMMFFGKIAYGISVPIIMSAGALQIPLKKFLAYSVPISILQTSAMVLIGYLLGEAYYLAIRYVQYPLLFISIALSATFVLIYYLKAGSKKILIK